MKTINIVIWILVIIAVVLGAIYLVMRSNVPATPAVNSATPPASSTGMPQTSVSPTNIPQTSVSPVANAAQPSVASVTIQNFSFQPTPLTVPAGTTVTWTNMDSVNHQIKSTTFNSAPLAQGQTYSFTFSAVGTYDYSCAIHPSMHGQIIVR